MDILGEPIKCAILVPTPLTFHPIIAKPKPQAQIPKLPAPEPIPDNPTAKAMPTVVIGETIKIAKIIAIKIHIIIGCSVNNEATPCPIKVVILVT